MGNYIATTTSIFSLLPGLTNDTATSTLISSQITRAESLIDSLLSRRYETPFSTSICPPLVITLAQDICCYFTMRSLWSRDGQNVNEWVKEYYDAAKNTIQQIIDRDVDLVNTAGSLIAERSIEDKIYSSTEDYIPAFDLDDDTAWEVDPDRIDDIEASKE